MRQKFFISFSSADRTKAHWIAWTLKEAGHDVAVHDWEIPAGGNAPVWMNTEIAWADRLIAVISPDYIPARYSFIEWASEIWSDPDGTKGSVIPVVVRATSNIPPMLRALRFIDLTNCSEAEATRRLIEGVEVPAPPQLKPTFKEITGESPDAQHAGTADKPFLGAAKPRVTNPASKTVSSVLRSWMSSPVAKGGYLVWYGTNRRPNNSSDATKCYSAERDSKVHYGMCRVYIPKAHKIGSLGSPWWNWLISGADDRLKLREIKEIQSGSFWRQIASRMSKLSVNERHAVIFIHGYNVCFNDAALRAAQIGFDLSIKGAMAFFSWPSQGTLAGYMADAATIEASEQDISNFMIEFVTKCHAEAVHIIAHSMGNRGVLRAVNRIALQAQQKSGVPFGQIILAAADVDADSFRQLCGAYTQIARRTTCMSQSEIVR